MSSTKFTHINPIQKIINQSTFIKKLNQSFIYCLEKALPALIDHCQLANYHDACLVIAVEDAAKASLLKFSQRELLAQFKQNPLLKNFTEIRIFCFNEAKKPDKPKTTLQINKDSQEVLASLATQVKHPRLRSAIQKLFKEPQRN